MKAKVQCHNCQDETSTPVCDDLSFEIPEGWGVLYAKVHLDWGCEGKRNECLPKESECEEPMFLFCPKCLASGGAPLDSYGTFVKAAFKEMGGDPNAHPSK